MKRVEVTITQGREDPWRIAIIGLCESAVAARAIFARWPTPKALKDAADDVLARLIGQINGNLAKFISSSALAGLPWQKWGLDKTTKEYIRIFVEGEEFTPSDKELKAYLKERGNEA